VHGEKAVKSADGYRRKLTRNEIVEAVPCPERELADEGEPG